MKEATSFLVKLLRTLVVAFGSAYLLVLALSVGNRIWYPWELEWMEGGCLGHVSRILAGKPLYVAPSLEFTPFIYPPGYFWVASLAARILGEGFLALRLVSVLSAGVCFVLIFLAVKRETGHRLAAFAATAVFAAAFEAGATWIDLARIDSLFLALLFAGLFAVRFAKGFPGLATGVLLFLAAFLTKQIALPIVVPVLLFLAVRRGRPGIVAFFAFVFLVVTVVLAGDRLTDGWFSYYLFRVPSQHAWLKIVWVSFWREDVLAPLSISCAGAGLFLLLGSLEGGRAAKEFWAIASLATCVAAYFARLHEGGWGNVLLPFIAVISTMFGLGIGSLASRCEGLGPELRGRVDAGLFLLVLLQLGQLLYNPARYIPGQADEEAGEALVKFLGGLQGEIYVPYHGYLLARVGRPPLAHWQAVSDVLRTETAPARALEIEIARAISEHRFSAIVMDSTEPLVPRFAAHYQAGLALFKDVPVFFPVSGVRMRPSFVFRPREKSEGNRERAGTH